MNRHLRLASLSVQLGVELPGAWHQSLIGVSGHFLGDLLIDVLHVPVEGVVREKVTVLSALL